MGKIEDLIKEKNLKPSDCVYHTWRDALNRRKQRTGKIRVLVLPDRIARVEYKCPECGHEDYTELPWKRPFSVKCSACGFRITVPRMKDQAKREAKAEV
ncbi:MAG: hypothetical protein J7K31_04155 [Candidatus Aenigmarchaeota archaeon]|nr:hypothetical protein [Candidatus Aenigmarchaeota archaeon]OYT58327.1 MAG: hypothetical protein B6U68_00020 [Candidatus Aenigmarchaeota archaeon ex4484_14]